MNTNVIRTAMEERLSGGTTLQGAVRQYIREKLTEGKENEWVAATVSAICAEFKNDKMTIIATSVVLGPDDIKAIDNVINDVSRICREMLGYSVVCTKRGNALKGKRWEYIPDVPKPRTTNPCILAAKAADPCRLPHFDPTVHMPKPRGLMDVENIIREYAPDLFVNSIWSTVPLQGYSAESIVAILVERDVDIVALGKALVPVIKERNKL